MPLIWEIRRRRYRDTNTGRLVTESHVGRALERSLSQADSTLETLARDVSRGQISPDFFKARAREEIKGAFARQYILGKGGGVGNMRAEDYGRMGAMLRQQYAYLNRFSGEIAAGDLSEAQIAARLKLYARSSRQAYERSNAVSQGNPKLPFYPGDGSTECYTNCQCRWRIERVTDANGLLLGWNCFWELGAAEHCPSCLARSRSMNPHYVAVGDMTPLLVDEDELYRD